jgi:glycosyltransferase involved in cell wall biosynthesis
MSFSPTLLHVFPTFAVGGSQMRFAALANRFGRQFKHVIVTMDGRADCRERLRPELDVSFPDIALRKQDTFGNLRRFRALLRALRPSRLLTYNWGSIECAMANWPGFTGHVHIEDGFGPEEADRQLPRRVLTRRYVLGRSTVVLPSRTLFKLATDVWKLSPKVLRYVPNGVDCERFGARDIPRLDWEGEGPIIGTVAALRPEKNLIRLLDAFRLVRERMPCRLLIAGDGAERSQLEQYAVTLGVAADVKFTGHIAATEKVYASLSVFALSSDTEQMPITVLEAMATGLPIASTDVGDVSQMVSPPNLPFITPLNADALAASIYKLLSDRDLAAGVAAANRKVVRSSFDQERMFADYKALFTA